MNYPTDPEHFELYLPAWTTSLMLRFPLGFQLGQICLVDNVTDNIYYSKLTLCTDWGYLEEVIKNIYTNSNTWRRRVSWNITKLHRGRDFSRHLTICRSYMCVLVDDETGLKSLNKTIGTWPKRTSGEGKSSIPCFSKSNRLNIVPCCRWRMYFSTPGMRKKKQKMSRRLINAIERRLDGTKKQSFQWIWVTCLHTDCLQLRFFAPQAKLVCAICFEQSSNKPRCW